MKNFNLWKIRIRCPHWTSVIIWITGIMALVGLTLKDLCPMMEDYYNDDKNAAVQITVVRNNDTIKPPQMFLCIPSYRDAFLFGIASKIRALALNETSDESCPGCINLQIDLLDVWHQINSSGQHSIKKIKKYTDNYWSMIIANQLFPNLTKNFFNETDPDRKNLIKDAEWLILYWLYSGDLGTTQESMKNRQNKEVDDLTREVILSACEKIHIYIRYLMTFRHDGQLLTVTTTSAHEL